MKRGIAELAIAALLGASATQSRAQDGCAALASKAPSDTTIAAAGMQAQGDFRTPGGHTINGLPGFCRVHKDPSWDWHGFDWNRDPARVRAAIGAVVDAVDPDLRPFQAHGGKLILCHGWADPIGNAFDTIHYYEAVEHTVPDTPSFARLFLFPGMGHCRGGIGPNSFDAIGALDA